MSLKMYQMFLGAINVLLGIVKNAPEKTYMYMYFGLYY